MKTKILLLGFIVLMAFVGTTNAQGLTGRAYYKSSSSFKFSMDSSKMAPEAMADIQRQLKKQMEKEYVLTFTQGESNWKQAESLGSGPASASSGGATIVINTGSSDLVLYKNLADQKYLEEKDLMGKEFLVNDKLNSYDWELSDETKTIGNYTCQKATYSKIVDSKRFSTGMEEMESVKDTVLIEAWYTPQIPVSHGPSEYWGLPGLILELHNAGSTLICEKIVLNPEEKVEIQIPNKGKEMSSADYRALAEEKMQDMMKKYQGKPGENQMVIKIGN
ncbi:GLPGLI family protein [Algoriphagus iocasae]|jgi:GLPGLI family protein|uniref:GLPGLI family protein n=1 Tax=Algoriphagus iocasae TaxID=1836499 RepID=A0A841MKW8_9BACT|nr:GLPGLI family protein [Algoriphagus iocasae]MBB6328932.1 GLPGLI family protein [Algoriphagus iocasae]